MSTLVVLMGLLVLSYVGSLLVDRRTTRGLGLPSGIEFVALGVLAGPSALGLVDRSLLTAFAPIAQVAIGWLAFGIGLEALHVGEGRIRVTNMLGGWLLGTLAAGAIGAAAFFAGRRVWALSFDEAVFLGVALAAAASGTARQTIRWMRERYDAAGPVTRRLAELAHAGTVVPLGLVGVLFARTTSASPGFALAWWGWLGVTLGIGLVLGAGAAVLLARELRLDESWGVLIGVSLFAIGLAVRLELAVPTVAFALGVALSLFSRHRSEIVAMVAPTERAVVVPALLLAGAQIRFDGGKPFVLLAAVLAARVVAQIACGGLVSLAARDARPAGGALGPSFLSAGTLSVGVALAVALRFPGRVGDAALLVTAGVALVGEAIGPGALKTALGRVGELGAVPEPVAADERATS